MKRLLMPLSALLIIAAACTTVWTAQGEIYEGTGQGYRGPITVLVRMDGGSITEITVVNSREDRFVGGAAIEELIEAVIEENHTGVDVVSGATITSRGFLDAVNNARLLAGRQSVSYN